METRRLLQVTRIAGALIIIGLPGAMSVGASSLKDSLRSFILNNSRAAVRESLPAKTVDQSNKRDPSQARPDRANSGANDPTPRSDNYRNERRKTIEKPNGDQPIYSDRKPANNHRPSQRSDGARSHPDNSLNHQGNEGNNPNSGSYHRPDSRPFTERDRHSFHARGYTPPIFRAGFYHYSQRPNYRPLRYGYWMFDNYNRSFCRRSVYFHYGAFPYVDIVRIHISPYIVLDYRSAPVIVDGGYYLERRTDVGLDDTLADIRTAWLDGRFDLIENHVQAGLEIAVLLDGKYDYSLDADDYNRMTADTIDQLKTVSFTWLNTRQRTNGDFTVFGKHTYRDASNSMNTVFVSYALRRIGREYVIVEVGSSTSAMI